MRVQRLATSLVAALLLAGLAACGDDGDGATVNDTGNQAPAEEEDTGLGAGHGDS